MRHLGCTSFPERIVGPRGIEACLDRASSTVSVGDMLWCNLLGEGAGLAESCGTEIGVPVRSCYSRCRRHAGAHFPEGCKLNSISWGQKLESRRSLLQWMQIVYCRTCFHEGANPRDRSPDRNFVEEGWRATQLPVLTEHTFAGGIVPP